MTTGITCTVAMVVLSAMMLVIPSAMAVEVAAPDALNATRDISEQMVYPGSTFTVTVTLSANEDVVAPALDEDIPDGWTVAENESAGAYYNEATSEWFWLAAMATGDSETVVYDVTVPVDAELQDYAMTGVVSAYGTDLIDVLGDETVTVAKEMSAARDLSEQTVFPGSTIRVTVTLTANEDVVAPALNEDLPDGWTVAENESAGAYYNEATSEWFWLAAMATGDSKTVVYDVTVPVDAGSQDYAITGVVSAHDTDLIDVRGEGTVTVVTTGSGDETTGNIVINEFVAKPRSGSNEWVELYNPTASDVSLDGWTLKDGGKAPKDLSGMSVPAGGYAVFSCNSSWLNNGGDIIHLNNTTANVDSVTYGNWDDGGKSDNAPKPGTGESTGRDPNGIDTDNDVADFQIFVTPTEGGENACDPPLGGYGGDGGSDGGYGNDGGSDGGDTSTDAGSVPPGSEMSVTRDISSQRVGPGSTFTVTLTILANKAVDVIAPTLTENVSIGTIVVDPDSTLDLADVSNGTLDVSDTWYNDSAAMWILPERIPGGGSLTVVYSVTVPDDAEPQEYSITGSASAYDVTSVAIGGEGEVTVAENVQSTMRINAGWNLVSIPVIPADASVDAVFGSNITPPIYEYDAGYKSVTSLEPTKGYWVLANSPIDIDITGIVPLDSEVTITIPPGWNLIGPVSPGVEVSSFTDITPPVYGYNAGYESATTLEQNRGYWVLANNETTLTMGGST